MSSFLVPWLLILYPIKIQPVLVGEVTSTGHFTDQYCSARRPVLVTSLTSTGWKSDLYRFVEEAQEVDLQTTTGLCTSDYCFDVKPLFVWYAYHYSFVPDTTIGLTPNDYCSTSLPR